MILGIKEKSIILTHTVYLLAIATNIPQQLRTGFVIQGHILELGWNLVHFKFYANYFLIYWQIITSLFKSEHENALEYWIHILDY